MTCRRVWYLDRQRRSPKLRVSRTQFPLAPQFAITAHVAQGQTIKEGVTTDLCIGPRGNPFPVYVAITRVQGREKLLIFRPFDAAPFQKGIGLGRDLLLRHLRREPINWQDLLAKYCEERVCSTCAERKPSTAFTGGQWKRDDKDRVCRECTKHYADAGTPWQCNVCKLWHVETNFPAKHRQRQCSFYRVCLTCEAKKPCFKCGVAKPEAEFGPAAWKARNADRRCCRECTTKQRGCWQCSQCSERKPRAEFTAWQQSRKHTQDGTQVCNACTAFAFVCRLAHRTNQRLARLRQRESRQRHEAILADVRKEIQKMHEARQTSTGTDETRTGVAQTSTQPLAARPDAATPRVYTYLCPHCAKSVPSTVTTGQVDHRRGDGCGKFFSRCEWPACRSHTCTHMSNMRHGGAFNKSFRANSNNASHAQRKAVSHRPMARAELITNGGFTQQQNSEGRMQQSRGPSRQASQTAPWPHQNGRALRDGPGLPPKQQGPEGRTGSAGHGPHCLTLLSEPTRKLAV